MRQVSSQVILFTFTLLFASLVSAQDMNRVPTDGFAIFDRSEHFKPHHFTRHAVGNNDIQIDILYSGICHSDLHHVFHDWGEETYPLIPGHEIVGKVVKVGKNVTKFKVGDYAGIGCLINSCGHCEYCKNGQEQYCKQSVIVFHDTDTFHGNEPTMGGFSNKYVLSADYAIKIPKDVPLEKVAPLLCAGITTYSPIRYAKVSAGQKVAVAGFGGLGHMALQYMKSLGADVTVFDISEDKRADAGRLGASRFVNVNRSEELKGLEDNFDFILSTIPAKYDPMIYVRMLKWGGKMCIVGLPPTKDTPVIQTTALALTAPNREVFGSLIGGIKETQEMLDYSVAHNIYPEVEVIKADADTIDQAFINVRDGKVKFRYVIDMSAMKQDETNMGLHNH